MDFVGRDSWVLFQFQFLKNNYNFVFNFKSHLWRSLMTESFLSIFTFSGRQLMFTSLLLRLGATRKPTSLRPMNDRPMVYNFHKKHESKTGLLPPETCPHQTPAIIIAHSDTIIFAQCHGGWTGGPLDDDDISLIIIIVAYIGNGPIEHLLLLLWWGISMLVARSDDR